MSELRQDLDSARRAYRTAVYPGNLAAEILSGSSSLSRRWLIGWMSIGALSAAASVVLLLGKPLATPSQSPSMASLQAIRSVRLPTEIPMQVPGLPDYLTVAPPLQKLIPQGVRDWFAGQNHETPPAMEPQMLGDPSDPV